jgi:hypothetical protein
MTERGWVDICGIWSIDMERERERENAHRQPNQKITLATVKMDTHA